MINIRPVSDLRNKYQDIETTILKDDENVYFTKNGYGAMVLISLERYTKMVNEINDKQIKNKSININNGILDEISGEEDILTEQLNAEEEIFPKIKKKML